MDWKTFLCEVFVSIFVNELCKFVSQLWQFIVR